jgi:predicted enzyme related to lactoylglutathione lyase
MLLRFSHMMIYTPKHEDTLRWYCEKLGYEIDYNAVGEYASLHHKQLGRLAIHATVSDKHIGVGGTPYLLCDDIKATVFDLRKKGIEVSEPEREGESPWFADFKDCVGNVWGVEEL